MRLSVKDGVSGVEVDDLHPWSFIKDLKDRLTEKLHVPSPHQRLFFAGRELKNSHTLNDCRIHDGATIFLATANHPQASAAAVSPSSNRDLINVYGDLECNADMLECINAVRMGLMAGLAPRLAMEGTGGTYFLRSRGKVNVGVFKAEDEEPFAPSNPRGYLGEMGAAGFRHGLVSGEGAVREVAAYLVDHDGFAGVPPTTRVEISKRAFMQHSAATGNVKRLSNGLSMFADPAAFSASLSSENLQAMRSGGATPSASSSSSLLLPPPSSMEFDHTATKVGSLQVYVEYDEVAGDVAPQLFPIHEVQKIAILDIRMFNIDRNEANILVQRKYSQPTAAGSRSSSISPEADGSTARVGSLFSPPSVGPSHLHHHESGFSPDNPFSFSPLQSPVRSGGFDSPVVTSASASQTPTLSATNPLSPDALPALMELPPAANISASFNLNYSSTDRAQSFEVSRIHSVRPTASIPIPIPSAISTRHSYKTPSFHSILSSSVPNNPPSRLQSRLQALKTMRVQQATVKPSYHLIPVDHSYTFPDTLELATVDWCWLDWPQVKEPLSPAVKDYVLRLDVKADIELLRTKLAIREECLKVMRISGMLLQKGVAADLTLFDIASLMCRKTIDKPSQLEVLCAQATTLARGIKDNVKRVEKGREGKKGRRVGGYHHAAGEAISPPLDGKDVMAFSPTAVTESDASSSSDSQDSPPQSADYSHQPLIGSPQQQPSTLSRMLQLNRNFEKTRDNRKENKPHEECKVEDEDALSPTCHSDCPSSRKTVIPTTSPAPSIPGSAHKTLPQPIPPASVKGSLTRSNSLDLILRRSISYDDFRAVRVNKAGFNMNSITTTAVIEQGDEDDSDDETTPPNTASVKDSTSPPSAAGGGAGGHYQAGAVYRVAGVYHHAEHEKRNVWSSEDQSRLFFSCLSGLMDSAIERLKAQKKEKANESKK